jgi:glycosyltransferase involved in cell wall biosynthesis
MKIAHFLTGRCNPDSANGIDKTVYYLSQAQAALRHEVAVFSLTTKPPLLIPGVMVRTGQPQSLPFMLPRALFTDLLDWQPDIVHMHSVYIPEHASVAHRLRSWGIPYVVTPNGGLSPYVLRRRRHLKWPYKRFCELPCLNRAAFVHAVADADDIAQYGVQSPIVTAPNGIDISHVPAAPQRELLVSRFPQARGKLVFLFLGRLDLLHKGLDLLLEGLALARLEEAILILIGPDWQGGRQALEQLARQLGVATQVVFADPAYGVEKFDLLAGADVFVHPSRWEGLPFSILEATALAKPCLVTPSADPCGQLTFYRGGITVQPDAKSVACGLRRFAELSAAELEAMGKNARLMVATEFTWESTAQTLVQAYITYATRTL